MQSITSFLIIHLISYESQFKSFNQSRILFIEHCYHAIVRNIVLKLFTILFSFIPSRLLGIIPVSCEELFKGIEEKKLTDDKEREAEYQVTWIKEL